MTNYAVSLLSIFNFTVSILEFLYLVVRLMFIRKGITSSLALPGLSTVLLVFCKGT